MKWQDVRNSVTEAVKNYSQLLHVRAIVAIAAAFALCAAVHDFNPELCLSALLTAINSI